MSSSQFRRRPRNESLAQAQERARLATPFHAVAEDNGRCVAHVLSPETRDADIANIEALQRARPLKPPMRQA